MGKLDTQLVAMDAGGFEVLMKSTGLGLKLEDIPSKKWSQARRCRISAEKAHPGHGFCSL